MKRLRATDRRVLRNWLPLAFAATIVIGLIYFAAQQNLRLSANDPQIQIAEDAASSFAKGASPESLSTLQTVDITTSLATFATVFDANSKIIVSSGRLGTRDIALPHGVLAYTKTHGEDRFTWQPQDGVRVAAVTRYYQTSNGGSGFVLVGRNLREVESRESDLLIVTAIAWAATMAGSLALRFVLTPKQ